jgi:plastocyanin
MYGFAFVLVGVSLLLSGCLHQTGNELPEEDVDGEPVSQGDTIGEVVFEDAQPIGFDFGVPKKAAHYETNAPAHGGTLPAVPVNVVIDFNFDLAAPSDIRIVGAADMASYAVGDTVIDENKLSMRRAVDPAAPDGLYRVTYDACWPDGSCHDGSFAFAIDRRIAESFSDMRGEEVVEIRMSDVAFMPAQVLVSKGTTVRWVNDDGVDHFVNTDPHPAHTFFRAQNSRGLAVGEQYETTFDQAGAYPYHCSAHADTMTGMIVVEE